MALGKIEVHNIEYYKRPCYVRIKDKEVKGLFYKLIERAGVHLKAYYGYYQVKDTFALVELEDGTFREVLPKDVRFIDGGDFDDWCWEDEVEVSYLV